MDRTDFRLLVSLFEDARQSYRSLGRRVGLTAPAVRERIQRLEALGTLRGFWLRPDAALFGRSDCVFMFAGPFQLDRVRAAIDKPDVAWVAPKIDGGVSIGMWTKDTDSAERSLVQLLGQSPSGRSVSPRNTLPVPTRLDWKILSALVDDPRRELQDVCRVTHLSSKTVRKRLAVMLKAGSVAITPVFGALGDGGDIVYTITVIGPIEFSEIQHALGEAALLRQVEEPKSQFALCRAINLGDVLNRTAALARHPDVRRSFVSLNRELLVNPELTKRLLDEQLTAP